MLPFHQAVADDFDAVNQLIIKELHSDVDLVENIGHYIIDAGGKRLRPLLVLLTANCLNYKGDQHLPLATVIEFIHTATLLHDDVVDISNLRRGRPTANAKWGNAPSVLVGDFLYSRAFQLLVKLGNMNVMRILSDTTNTISEGEVQQLVNAKDPSVSEDNYFNVIYKKTAALFEAACACAAEISDCNVEQTESALLFGKHLGIAFQLVDDALDYQGSAAELGKNVGDDLAEGKPTLPLIFAMREATEADQALISAAIESGGLDNLNQIVDIVKSCGALEYTMQCAKEHKRKALQALEILPQNAFNTVLQNLAEFAVARSF